MPSWLFLILGFYFIVYFVLLRPQKKQQREHATLLENLKKNDLVRTSGGIFGRVVSVDQDRNIVVLKIDEQNNVRMRVLRSTVEAVVTDEKKDKTSGDRTTEKAEVG